MTSVRHEFDSETRSSSTPSYQYVGYSDGEEVERGLLDVIEAASDVSSMSQELVRAIVDWPTEYHLSNVRHNLLRPFGIGSRHKVLELGCGCGAMTRYLAECGAEVVAVEGSAMRARIAAARCRDLPNVRVYCNNLIDFTSSEKFDFVLLIGVLEYAPKFIGGNDPVGRCLSHARGFLKEDGALLLAIENQLGLKYFNGCAEDHCGIPFYGVCDLYGRNDPATFGRRELALRLSRAGFVHQEFFFPFPDYKLPNLVISSAALDSPTFRLEEVLFRSVGKNRGERGLHSFFEPLVWPAILRNELFADLTHSFLVLAKVSSPFQHVLGRDWLACHYSAERQPNFATETVFWADAERGVRVDKELLYGRLFRETAPSMLNGRLVHCPAKNEQYIAGNLYVGELQKLLANGAGVDAIANWAGDWLRLLHEAACFGTSKPSLAGRWLDAIPTNFIRTPDGSLTRFDKEWVFFGDIPLAWVAVRGMVNALAVCPTSSALMGLSLRRVVDSTLERVAFPVRFDDADYATVAHWETELVRTVYGDHSPIISPELFNQPAKCSISGPSWQDKLTEELMRHEAELRQVKSTVSWRITKPLRACANVAKRLLQRNSSV